MLLRSEGALDVLPQGAPDGVPLSSELGTNTPLVFWGSVRVNESSEKHQFGRLDVRFGGRGAQCWSVHSIRC